MVSAEWNQKGIDQIDCILKKTSKKTKEKQAKALLEFIDLWKEEQE